MESGSATNFSMWCVVTSIDVGVVSPLYCEERVQQTSDALDEHRRAYEASVPHVSLSCSTRRIAARDATLYHTLSHHTTSLHMQHASQYTGLDLRLDQTLSVPDRTGSNCTGPAVDLPYTRRDFFCLVSACRIKRSEADKFPTTFSRSVCIDWMEFAVRAVRASDESNWCRKLIFSATETATRTAECIS